MPESSDTPHPKSAPTPSSEIRRLGALVGRWRSEGQIVGDAPVPITGTDIYEWLPGGFFLVHHVDVVIGDQEVKAIEIIGEYDPATDSFTGRAYDNLGNITIMRARVDDNGVWTFTGAGDIAPVARPASADSSEVVRSTLTVSADKSSMTAKWGTQRRRFRLAAVDADDLHPHAVARARAGRTDAQQRPGPHAGDRRRRGHPAASTGASEKGDSPMDLQIRRFDQPDESRTFEKGEFQLVTAGGMTLGRASYEPGWKWSQHVGPTVGTDLCDVEHVGIVISGRAAVRMADGTELVMEAGDVFAIPPGHDSWVVGEEPYVSLHLLGATNYAAGPDEA